MSHADLHRIRAFFGPRAADWERRVAKDAAQIERAVNEANLRTGMTVLELGCGTAPAAPWLRAAVGPGGRVIAVDVTPEMIGQARRAGRGAVTGLVVASDADGDTLSYGGSTTTTKGSVIVTPVSGGFIYTPTAAARHRA